MVRLFLRNSICSICPACSARARGVGASGSPEKQLIPAPQPRSAWVSARSVVVTAAHRAWEGRGGRKGSVPAGVWGQWGRRVWGEERGRMRKEAPRSRGTHPQVGREKTEEEKQKRGGGREKPRERGWTGAAQQRPGSQHPGLTPAAAPGPCQLPGLLSGGAQAPSALWKGRGGCFVANSSHI